MLLCVNLCVELGGNGMATNLSIDQQLLNEAVVVGGFNTKKDAVNQALKEFIQRRKQKKIIDLFGKMPADSDYDYKKGRT
jgi:hypothetical protein